MAYFGRFQQRITNVAPWFLRQKNIASVLEGVGVILDGAADGMLAGMRLGYPLRCPANQLPVIARDRGIPVYSTEPEASQREGLRKWWWLHKLRGSHQGEMRNAQRYFLSTGLPTFRVVHLDGTGSVATWHTLDASTIATAGAVFPRGRYSKSIASPANFDYDGQHSKWARFWVFIDMSTSGYTAPATWGSFNWGDGTLWGQGGARPFTAQAAADVVSMILGWKAGDSWCAGIILVWPGAAAFPSSATTPTQDAAGWWSLPNGAGTWESVVLPAPDGRASRPPNFQWIYESAAP